MASSWWEPLTACATKKFVRTEVDAVGQRVETLSQSLETTQEQTRQNQAAITKVDAKADQVGIWAKDAQSSASNAQQAATTAQQAATTAFSRVDAVDAASKRLVYEVVINEDQGNFKFASTEPAGSGADAHRRDDRGSSRRILRGNFVEIEGHTDSSGDKVDQSAHRRSPSRSGEALSL